MNSARVTLAARHIVSGLWTSLVVVLILQGLGGSANAAVSRSLTPVEALPAWVARYQAAVDAIRAGDCARFDQLNLRQTLGLTCDPPTRQRLTAGFQILGYQQFSTGAIVDTLETSRQTHRPGIYTTILALGPGRMFHSLGSSGFGTLTGGGIRQVATHTAPRTARLAARTARLALVALRIRSCNLFYTTWATGARSKGPACARVFGARPSTSRARRLRFELTGDPTAIPVRIGGTRDMVFFRLRLRTGHYWTLEVDRSGTTTGPLAGGLYITTARDAY
jgi:hypothetical protein